MDDEDELIQTVVDHVKRAGMTTSASQFYRLAGDWPDIVVYVVERGGGDSFSGLAIIDPMTSRIASYPHPPGQAAVAGNVSSAVEHFRAARADDRSHPAEG